MPRFNPKATLTVITNVALGGAYQYAPITGFWKDLLGYVACTVLAFSVLTWLCLSIPIVVKFRRGPKGRSPMTILIVCIVGAIISGGLWLLIDPLSQRVKEEGGLPGLSLHMYIRIDNLYEDRRKYLFDFGKVGKERLSIYISRDNNFTFSFVDAKGESHSIQIALGDGRINLGKFCYLSCEVGINGQNTLLRVFVDGDLKERLLLPFKTDIGGLNISNGVIGADLNGENGAAFAIEEFIVRNVTASNRVIEGITKYFAEEPHTSHIQGNGSQWMRFSDAKHK